MNTTHPRRLQVAYAYERFSQLAWPVGKQDSPVALPKDINEWVRLAGIGQKPEADVVKLLFPGPLEVAPHLPRDIATEAMRRMIREGLAEPMGPRASYRAVPNRGAHP
jgi:hypothetical protein